MADRFWVGGSGAWDATNTANWATTPGGAGGASVPTSTDDVYFGSWSGTGTVNIGGSSASVNCGALRCEAGYVGTFNTVGYGLTIYRDLILAAGMVASNFVGYLQPYGVGAYTIDLAGCTISRLNLREGYAVYTAASDINLRDAFVLYCSLDMAGYNISTTRLYSTYGPKRDIDLGGGVVNIYGTSLTPFQFSGAGLTLVADQTSIVINSGSGLSPKAFTSPNGSVFKSLRLMGTPRVVSVAGANTFKALVVDPGHTIQLPSNGATSVGNFAVSGTATKPAYITSMTTSPASLIYTGQGMISTDYIHASYISAAPATNTWYVGKNSVDGGNNTGLIFDYPPLPRGVLFFGSTF